MNSGERELLVSTVERLVASVDGVELTSALDDFGWIELLENSPKDAISTVFSALGKFDHWSAALQDVMSRELEGLLGSRGQSSVLIPWPRQQVTGTLAQDTLILTGLLFQPRPISSIVVVVRDDDGSHELIEIAPDQVQMESRGGLDPSLGSISVEGSSGEFRVLATGSNVSRWWDETFAIARVSVCYSLVALSRRMMEFATEHASNRQQFGQPIGTFQAIRHRLAESLVAVDAAEAIVTEAWRSENFGLAAATAKLVTSNTLRIVASHAQQVLAGIGFTVEHDFQRFMKRAVTLDRLFDNSVDLTVAIGADLVKLGHAPRLFEL